MRITSIDIQDIRFPTSDEQHGSDAVHVDPDYSAAYVVIRTDGEHQGHGLAFTCGRGTEVICSAIRALSPMVVGRQLEEITSGFGAFWRSMAEESQLRWLGPQKGVIHMAMAAIINALWALWARSQSKPLWKLLVDLEPSRIIDCIDFTWITDLLDPDQALAILESMADGRAEREQEMLENGYPAYTTSAGWLGYSDEKIRGLCEQGLAEGWRHFKFKVGQDLDDDRRRLAIARKVLGPDHVLMIDANQVWDVGQAIEWVGALAEFNPLWIEEPTSPDDVLGHATIARAIAPIGVATGEACQNRVIFKQLLQAEAISFCQVDACRLGGVNEVIAVMLMAASRGVPVCPHAGGVGLCEHVQHLSIFDYVAVSGTLENRVVEFVDHLHEHFEDPCVIRDGRYRAPLSPGYSIAMKPESLAEYAFPDGPIWVGRFQGSKS